MDIDLVKVAVTPKIRRLKTYVIHEKGITIVRIGGSPFYEMEAWLEEYGGTVLHDDQYAYSRVWKVTDNIKLLFALRWADANS